MYTTNLRSGQASSGEGDWRKKCVIQCTMMHVEVIQNMLCTRSSTQVRRVVSEIGARKWELHRRSAVMGTSRFLKPFYVCNVILIVGFVYVRAAILEPGELGERDILGFTRETSIYTSAILLLIARAFSAATLDAYLSTSFKVIAFASCVLLWFMDTFLLKLFATLHLLVHVLCPQPRVGNPTCVDSLDTRQLDSVVLRNSYKGYRLVWVHATWSAHCTELAPVLSDFVHRASHARMKFARVDVGRTPAAAERLNVSMKAGSRQLPCAILFRRGKEVGRVPGVTDGGDIERRWRKGFSANDLWKEFDMAKALEEAEKWEEDARQLHKKQKPGGKKSD